MAQVEVDTQPVPLRATAIPSRPMIEPFGGRSNRDLFVRETHLWGPVARMTRKDIRFSTDRKARRREPVNHVVVHDDSTRDELSIFDFRRRMKCIHPHTVDLVILAWIRVEKAKIPILVTRMNTVSIHLTIIEEEIRVSVCVDEIVTSKLLNNLARNISPWI